MGLTCNTIEIYDAFNLEDYYCVKVIFSDTKEERLAYFKKMSIAGEYVQLYDTVVNITDSSIYLSGSDFDGVSCFAPGLDIGYIYYDAVDKISIYPPNEEDGFVLFEKTSLY